MKRLLLILLIPLLALVLISCDQDMRSGIAGFLGGFGGNTFVDSGLVSENTANAEAASNHITGLGIGGNAGTVGVGGKIDEGVFGIEIDLSGTIDGNTSFLAPQSKKDQDALKEQLGDTLNSPKQKDKFKKDMAEKATDDQNAAAQGTADILNAVLEQLMDDNNELDFLKNLKLPEIDDETELTQGDILILQMMTDLVANTIGILNDIAEDGDLSDLDEDELKDHIEVLMDIVDDALFAAQMADELSGSSSIDFTGGLDLATLLGQMTSDRSTRALARADGDGEDFDIGEMLPALFGLSKDITKTMGAKIEANAVTIDKGTYQSFLLMMSAYRSSLEYAFTIVDSGSLTLASLNNDEHIDLSTVIKYFLAVLLTENDEYLKTLSPRKSSREILQEFFTANQNFVTGEPSGDEYEPEIPEGMESTYDGFQAYIEDKKDVLNETIKNTLMGINRFAGSTQLGALLGDFDLSDLFGDDGEDE